MRSLPPSPRRGRAGRLASWALAGALCFPAAATFAATPPRDPGLERSKLQKEIAKLDLEIARMKRQRLFGGSFAPEELQFLGLLVAVLSAAGGWVVALFTLRKQERHNRHERVGKLIERLEKGALSQLAAVQQIAALGAEGIPLLLTILTQSQNPEVRRLLRELIARRGGRRLDDVVELDREEALRQIWLCGCLSALGSQADELARLCSASRERIAAWAKHERFVAGSEAEGRWPLGEEEREAQRRKRREELVLCSQNLDDLAAILGRILRGRTRFQNRKLNLADLSLKGADLRRAHLQAAVLSRTRLTGADLRGARLKQADLTEAILAGAKLSGVSAAGAHFDRATLLKTLLTGADLRSATFEDAILNGTVLSRARLRDATFGGSDPKRRATARGAIFIGADLSGADLSHLDLYEARFDAAKLHGTRFAGSVLVAAQFRNATGDGTRFTPSPGSRCNLARTSFAGSQTRFTRALFEQANLGACELEGATFRDCDFSRAEISGKVSFDERTRFEGCDFATTVWRDHDEVRRLRQAVMPPRDLPEAGHDGEAATRKPAGTAG